MILFGLGRIFSPLTLPQKKEKKTSCGSGSANALYNDARH
ncbi:hypothetical protein GPUN_0670 [Glaciecola punicea ACAM 611]|uniref:Uncharacterized protein n=1 Tax=Glaciecola punicea ACAM 611 TaxID=1121923 RepID=H5T933_9ALTE|nr:hypothetical protein GPUN_0670 [Glaciecola punicea ACAM 611]